MNKNKKVRVKNKPIIKSNSKQTVGKYIAPIPIKLSNGEGMYSMREESSKPVIIKNGKTL